MEHEKQAGEGSLKLLVVDDDADLRRTLFIQLSDSYTVFEAADGREALRIIRQERPRLMFLDVSMPGMDGLETLASARKIDGAILVIMLTGERDLGTAKRALEIGALEYVTKPFDSSYLREEVRRLLEANPEEDRDDPPWRVVE